MRVIDYAWGRPSIASLKAGGTVAVVRYLSYDTTGKNLSRAEADNLRANGLDIVSNWEAAGSWAEFSQGRAKGQQHARDAATQHTAFGGPAGRPIYFSADFNPTSAQLPTIADYYRGVADVIGLSRTGAYGGYASIKYLFDQGVISYGWQTYAWSSGQWDGRAQLRQIQNGITVGGIDCDLDDSRAADFGQWAYASGVDMTPDEHDRLVNVDQTCNAMIRGVAAVLTTGTQANVQAAQLGRVEAALATANANVTALTAAFTALASSGSSIDTAAVIAAVTEASQAESELVANLQAEITALNAKLSKAGQDLT